MRTINFTFLIFIISCSSVPNSENTPNDTTSDKNTSTPNEPTIPETPSIPTTFQVSTENVKEIYFINCSPSYKKRGFGGGIEQRGEYKDRRPFFIYAPYGNGGLSEFFPTKAIEVYTLDTINNTYINSNLNFSGAYGGWLSRYHPQEKILVYYHESQTPDLSKD